MTRSRISIRRSHTTVAALVGILGASLGHGASLTPSAGAAAATTRAAAKPATAPSPDPATLRQRGPVPRATRSASPKQQIPFPTLSPTTQAPTTTPTTRGGGSDGGAYLEDFSKPLNWSLWADAEGFVGLTSFKENAVMGFVLPPDWALLTFVLEQGFADIDVSAKAMMAVKSGAQVAGVFCRGQGRARYEFLVASNSAYAIWKTDSAGKYTNITPGGKWLLSDAIPKDFDEINVGARCRGDQLTLLVDGRELVTVRDRSITGSGSVGLVTNNFDENKPARIFFDDVEFRI